ncbi:putative surface protease GP63 [Trypanosoma cruzi]|nr:putative surface protease GP63 [Trypanosoma cruzi]
MTLNIFFFYTATEWSNIGARMLELVRQHGEIQLQLTFFDENRPLDAVVTVAATMTCLRLVSAKIAKHWEDSTLTGHIADLRAPQAPNFETQLLLPIIWG